jgi:hypothetical protein
MLVGRRSSLPDRLNLSVFTVSLISFHFFAHDMSILLVPLSATTSEGKGVAMRAVLLVSSVLGIVNWHIYLVALGTLTAWIIFILDRHAVNLTPNSAAFAVFENKGNGSLSHSW